MITLKEVLKNIKLDERVKGHLFETEQSYLNLLGTFNDCSVDLQGRFLRILKEQDMKENNKVEDEPELKTAFLVDLNNGQTALDMLINDINKNGKLTERMLGEAQNLIVFNGKNFSKLGSYRDHQVWIGKVDSITEKIIFEPPTAEEVKIYMEEFLNFYNQDIQGDLGNPFIKSAIVHYWCVRVHPFADGNGRISRILQSISFWQLSNNNYHCQLMSPLLYLSKNFNLTKEMYVKKENDLHNDITNNEYWNKWFEYNLIMCDEQIYYLSSNLENVKNSYYR
ncbi:MAG: Fic family protein [Bacilli bacterium]